MDFVPCFTENENNIVDNVAGELQNQDVDELLEPPHKLDRELRAEFGALTPEISADRQLCSMGHKTLMKERFDGGSIVDSSTPHCNEKMNGNTLDTSPSGHEKDYPMAESSFLNNVIRREALDVLNVSNEEHLTIADIIRLLLVRINSKPNQTQNSMRKQEVKVIDAEPLLVRGEHEEMLNSNLASRHLSIRSEHLDVLDDIMSANDDKDEDYGKEEGTNEDSKWTSGWLKRSLSQGYRQVQRRFKRRPTHSKKTHIIQQG